MVWYNPFTWGQTEETAPAAPAPAAAPAAAPVYGARRRKTHRRGRKASRRSRSGRKPSH